MKYNGFVNSFDLSVEGLASSIVGGILNAFRNDAVKNYPIRSENTFRGIVSEIKGHFKPPANRDQALQYLKDADFWKSEADRKIAEGDSKDVLNTYKMMLDEMKVAYGLYLMNGKFVYPDYQTGGKAFSGVDVSGVLASLNVPGYSGGSITPGEEDPDKVKKDSDNTLILILVLVVAFILFKKGR